MKTKGTAKAYRRYRKLSAMYRKMDNHFGVQRFEMTGNQLLELFNLQKIYG